MNNPSMEITLPETFSIHEVFKLAFAHVDTVDIPYSQHKEPLDNPAFYRSRLVYQRFDSSVKLARCRGRGKNYLILTNAFGLGNVIYYQWSPNDVDITAFNAPYGLSGGYPLRTADALFHETGNARRALAIDVSEVSCRPYMEKYLRHAVIALMNRRPFTPPIDSHV